MRDLFRDPRQQRQFEHDGYLTVNLATADDIERLVELHDRYSSDLTASNAWSFSALSSNPIHRKAMSDGIRAVLEPRLGSMLDRCRTVLGNFFHKQPSRAESRIQMHQDWSWVDERVHDSLNVWCPCQAVDRDNGTLAVVPGSHRLSERPRAYVARFPYLHFVPLLSGKYSRHLVLEQGQAVLFHQRLFHWSGPNLAPAPRLAAACLVAPQEAGIVFPYADPDSQTDEIDLYEVDDELLYSFVPGVRPLHARRIGKVDAGPEPLDESSLERILGGHPAPPRPT